MGIKPELIGAKLRSLRKHKRWTQQQLSDICNFPGQWKVSRIEGAKKGSGIRDLDTLEVICGAFGIELWELLKPDEIETNEGLGIEE